MISTHPVFALPAPAVYEKETLDFLKTFRFDGHQPSLEHIAGISRYFSRLPYENISKILKKDQQPAGQRLRLPDEVVHDHFTWQLGGTCFSLTYFLCGIYNLLGYDAQPLICHLNWGQNNHSAVMLQFAGTRFLVDPGYMIFHPLPLKKEHVRSSISSETGLSLRFDPVQDAYAVYTYRKGNYTRRYHFADVALHWDDFARHWDASFELPGMNDLTLTRIQGNEMLFIQGDFIKITAPEKVLKLRERNRAEQLIRDRFGIPLEKLEEARYIIKGAHS